MSDSIPPPRFLLTDATTITMVTPIGAYVYEKKTLKLKGFVPEKYPGLHSSVAVLSGAIDSLGAAEGVKGLEELRGEAAKLMASSVSSVEAVVQEALVKPAAKHTVAE